jgi:hypothetical protein
MGWVQTLFRPFRTREARRRPWVSPQFLGIITGIGLLSAGAYVWLQTDGGGQGFGGMGPAQRGGSDALPLLRAYVGFDTLAALQAQTDVGGCNLDCRVLRAWTEWQAAHPDAEILSQTPVYEAGILLGYWVEYREA